MQRKLVVILCAVVVAVACAVSASASTVGTLVGGMFAAKSVVTNPTATQSVSDLQLTTSGGPPTVSAVVVTVTGNNLTALNGQSAIVDLLGSSGNVVTSLSATLTSGGNLSIGSTSATITLAVAGSPLASSYASWTAYIAGVQAVGGGASGTQRAVTLGNGTIAANTWTSPVVPPTGANPATTIVTITPSNVTPYSTCLTVSITGTSSTRAAWGFTIDYSKPPYYGVQPQIDAHAVIASTAGTVLTLKGTSNGNTAWEEWGNNALISNAQTLNVLVCVYNVGTAPDEPQAYTVSNQVHGATWTNTRACIDRTITGNGLYPFYFGWSTTFDMTDAIALLKTNDAGSPRAFVYQPNPTTPSTYTAGTAVYTMTNYRDNEVSGTGSTVAELCVTQY